MVRLAHDGSSISVDEPPLLSRDCGSLSYIGQIEVDYPGLTGDGACLLSRTSVRFTGI